MIHRWDYETPIEETMEALHDVVRAGKARYIGASAMFAWQFQKALHVAEKHGWTRFVSMQDHLNLIYREEEREMLPLCRAEKIGVIPYSPLASGRLTRDWSSESTLRSETDQIAKGKYDATAETDRQVVERVAEIAEKHGVPRVHIALAWLLQKQPVTAPIIGATKITHLEDAVGALSVKLTQEEVAYLEEPYVPHPHRRSSVNKEIAVCLRNRPLDAILTVILPLPLGDYTDNALFGDVWERPGLSKRDRGLITVATLVALYRAI